MFWKSWEWQYGRNLIGDKDCIRKKILQTIILIFKWIYRSERPPCPDVRSNQSGQEVPMVPGPGTNQVLILLFVFKTVNLSHRFILIGIRILDFNGIRIMDNAVEDGIGQSGF